ncbi:MAG: hypothetical protein JWO36_555 [Myxococcales bacterium]|nr:hypothetical protein [Myxococcales bacterium]
MTNQPITMMPAQAITQVEDLIGAFAETACHAPAMRVAFVLAVVALGRVAHADTDCAHVLARLDHEVAEASAHPIKLASPPVDADGQRCTDAADTTGREGDAAGGSATDAPTVETGTLSGDRATVRSDGPHGSGRYWSIDVRVVNGGHQLGACMQTSTTWWRNLPGAARKSLGVWHVLDGGAFFLWSTLAIGDSEWESLALPLVYRVSKHQLVLDRKLTTSAVARFGRMYRDAAAVADDDARAMHVSAAAAYAAFATQGACKP